jgi:hypothetical protein
MFKKNAQAKPLEENGSNVGLVNCFSKLTGEPRKHDKGTVTKQKKSFV